MYGINDDLPRSYHPTLDGSSVTPGHLFDNDISTCLAFAMNGNSSQMNIRLKNITSNSETIDLTLHGSGFECSEEKITAGVQAADTASLAKCLSREYKLCSVTDSNSMNACHLKCEFEFARYNAMLLLHGNDKSEICEIAAGHSFLGKPITPDYEISEMWETYLNYLRN